MQKVVLNPTDLEIFLRVRCPYIFFLYSVQGSNEYYAGGAQSGLGIMAPGNDDSEANDDFVKDVFKVIGIVDILGEFPCGFMRRLGQLLA